MNSKTVLHEGRPVEDLGQRHSNVIGKVGWKQQGGRTAHLWLGLMASKPRGILLLLYGKDLELEG